MAETGTNTKTATNTGLSNMQSVFKEFLIGNHQKDDTAGQALKNTWMADTVTTVFNNQMAKDLAYTNAEIATGQMTEAAKLELANTRMVRKDDHDYGMQKMGAEYDFQSKFAVDEANRALNAEAQKGDIAQNQTKLEGTENRLNIAAQGREELNQIGAKGDEANRQIVTQGNVDVNKIGAQGAVDRENIKTQGNVDVNKIGAQGQVDQQNIYSQGDVDKSNIVAQGNVDVNKIGAQGQVDQKNIETQGNVDVNKIGAQGQVDKANINAQGYMDQALQKIKGTQALDQISGQGDQDVRKIGATGSEERKNMMQQTKEEDKTAARQSKYARGLAGMF